MNNSYITLLQLTLHVLYYLLSIHLLNTFYFFYSCSSFFFILLFVNAAPQLKTPFQVRIHDETSLGLSDLRHNKEVA